jgi:hypothetical protein
MDDILEQLDADMESEASIDVEETVAEETVAEETVAEETVAEETLTPRQQLEARARALGLTFRSTISDATLLKRIEEAEQAGQAEPASEVAPEVTPEVTSDPETPLSPQTLAEMAAGAALLKSRQLVG